MSAPSATYEQKVRANTIGKLVKDARMRLNLTQAEVAASLGYESPQFVSNWERGISAPPFDAMPALIRLLDIPPSQMLETVSDFNQEVAKHRHQQLHKLLTGRRRRS